MTTYLTAKQLAEKLHYSPRYISNHLKDKVLIEGVHYFRPFGRRRILYVWEAIEIEMARYSEDPIHDIPLSN